MLKLHFPDDRAKYVNVEIWLELNCDLVKLGRSSCSQNMCNEAVSNDLETQTSDLSVNRTGSANSVKVMASMVAAVRGVKLFAPVYHSSPTRLQELESSLRSWALESNRLILKDDADVRSFTATNNDETDLQRTD